MFDFLKKNKKIVYVTWTREGHGFCCGIAVDENANVLASVTAVDLKDLKKTLMKNNIYKKIYSQKLGLYHIKYVETLPENLGLQLQGKHFDTMAFTEDPPGY